MARKGDKSAAPHFATTKMRNVPQGRKGKHRQIVSEILSDLDQLRPGSAIKIPLSTSSQRANVRAALNRITRQRGPEVETSSDDDFLYIWKKGAQSPSKRP